MTEPEATSVAEPRYKLGPVTLSAGIRPRNAITQFYSAMLVIVYITVLNLLQPFILYEHLGMPTEVQGNFTGNLYVATELLTLLLVVPIGILSDRIGRRPIMALAFLFFGIGLFLIPLVTTKEMLVVLRLVTALGAACGVVMVASLLADYPDNAARGKMISINGICTGLGIVLIASFGLAQLPEYFTSRGHAPTDAGRFTFWIAGGIALVTAGIAWAGIKPGCATSHEDKPSMRESMGIGYREIRQNPKLILGCAATYVSRGDLTVLASFFALWLVAVGTGDGMSTSDAQGGAGRLFGISQIALIFFTPFVGWLVDRLDRVTTLAGAMALATIGYAALGIVGDPFNNPWIYPVALLAGMGEAGVIVTAPALVGQEAPARFRGSIFGFIAFAGAIGVLVNVKISGVLFDAWMYQAPFLFMAVLNFIVFIWAAIVRVKYGAAKTGSKSVDDSMVRQK
jgi:MFS family permease